MGAEPMQGICWMPCHHLLVTSDSCMQEVQDYVVCGAVMKGSRKEKIIETTVTCKFIDPSIEISAGGVLVLKPLFSLPEALCKVSVKMLLEMRLAFNFPNVKLQL